MKSAEKIASLAYFEELKKSLGGNIESGYYLSNQGNLYHFNLQTQINDNAIIELGIKGNYEVFQINKGANQAYLVGQYFSEIKSPYGYITTAVAAKMLNVTTRQIRYLVEQGKIEGQKLNKQMMLVKKSDVVKLASEK
jgi:excisionase family DNA binding protein